MAREQQIIDIAVGLIQQLGVANVTMDKVVAAVPYSKGTVYKHFSGKEDLLLAISNQAMSILGNLFLRASQYQGCNRERMLLLNFSYLIYAILYPALFQTVVCSKSPNVYGKSSEERLKQQQQLELKLMGAIHGIVEQAKLDNSLIIPSCMDIQQICFANWSMSYGVISLLTDDVELCEGRNGLIVERELFNQNNLMFDGLKWSPYTDDKDYRQGLNQALKTTFPKELALMEERGRILTF